MAGEDDELKGLFDLPEVETVLDNLTEFNTAHNKGISALTTEDRDLDIQRLKRKRNDPRVTFSDDDVVTNPADVCSLDVDPSVGHFRNTVETAIVPAKKRRIGYSESLSVDEAMDMTPDVDRTLVAHSTVAMNPAPNPAVFNPEVVNEPEKKKYPKEVWPGKKPGSGYL